VSVGLSTVRRSIISAVADLVLVVAETIVSVRGCGSGSEISTLASPRIVTVAITVGALAIVAVALVVMDVAVAVRTEGVVEAVPTIRRAMALVTKEGRLTTLCERGSCGTRWTTEMEVVWASWVLSGPCRTRWTTVEVVWAGWLSGRYGTRWTTVEVVWAGWALSGFLRSERCEISGVAFPLRSFG